MSFVALYCLQRVCFNRKQDNSDDQELKQSEPKSKSTIGHIQYIKLSEHLFSTTVKTALDQSEFFYEVEV